MTKLNLSITGAFMLVSFVFAGCGGSEIVMKPDYSTELITTQRIADSHVKIVKVVDRRNVDSTTIGTGRVGLFEKEVPYRLSVPLTKFVLGVLDSDLVPSPPDSNVSAVVYIDSFDVGAPQSIFTESAKVDVKMNFGIPVSSDSMLYIVTRANEVEETFSHATPLLEPMIYKSVVDCGRQFAATLRKLDLKLSPAKSDTTPRLFASVPGSTPSGTIEAVALAPQAKFYDDFGVGYSVGGKITSEIRIYGDIMTQKDSSNTMTGFGLNLNILSVTNKSAAIKGSFVVYGGNFTLRQFFSESTNSPYLGLQGTLVFGSETIKYPDHQESSFFFGPIVRETLGISFNKRAYLEAGLYECALLGSKMLPSDFGFTCGLTFGI
ncbi:MAG TPA: hypothetical protein VLX91_00810 [Candidatus Acidoferrales bacterium]|nr:hypothetical protein [Candidatus Acidoferrales bacterium]